MSVSFSALFFLVYCIHCCVIHPLWVSKVLQKRRAQAMPIPQRKIYLRGMTHGCFFAALALLVAALNQVPVFGSSHMDLNSILLAAAFLALNLGFDSLEWKYTSIARKKLLYKFGPHTAQARLLWVPVSLVAGVGQEIVFRAVLFGLLYRMIGDYWIAATISAVLFALMHFGMAGVLSTIGLLFVALGLQWLVLISGGLYAAIAVHFLHNLINGIVYGAMPEPVSADESLACEVVAPPEIAATGQDGQSDL